MANEYKDDLTNMLNTMVAARRKYAKQGNVEEVIDYQSKIEAILRALDHEKKLNPPKMHSVPLDM
ncbi:hypothetical protein [Hoeflea sp.]|uniref:hypothetical protein n=1 Tax=Hoeflea sp. TaxID=1940281 RepID=UPI003A926D17